MLMNNYYAVVHHIACIVAQSNHNILPNLSITYTSTKSIVRYSSDLCAVVDYVARLSEMFLDQSFTHLVITLDEAFLAMSKGAMSKAQSELVLCL